MATPAAYDPLLDADQAFSEDGPLSLGEGAPPGSEEPPLVMLPPEKVTRLAVATFLAILFVVVTVVSNVWP